jgi:GH15 family glucan-1,4-alpha-glucosidase
MHTVEYWLDPDNGMWEEAEELHASSLGAVVAGLKKAQSLPFITVPDGDIKLGEEALTMLLPRESASKFCDLALLSLFYPYGLMEGPVADEVLENMEYHLARRGGVVRYKNDRYYNKNNDGVSEEAEWTFGFPWLSIIYSRRGDRAKAEHYLQKTREIILPSGEIPELYYSNSRTPNENTPLGWAESLYIVALAEAHTSGA